MMFRPAAACASIIGCLLCGGLAAEDGRAGRADRDAGHSAAPEAAQTRMDPRRPDQDLLDAAVCRETNRRRAEHGLPPLAVNADVREAAALHARAMARHGFIGHENPFDDALKTPLDRVRRAGLEPRFLAENVASAFAREYEPGERAYVRTEDGRQIVSDRPEGAPIPAATYAGFAKDLLDGWMDSAGHRKNILHGAPEYIGCACAMLPAETLVEKAACAQVFFTPRG